MPLSSTSVCQNVVCEVDFVPVATPDDPWAELKLDVEFIDPDGAAHVVPAFWAGSRSWRARYSSPVVGIHQYRTIVLADRETGLEDCKGTVSVTAYSGGNPLLLHGAPTIAPDHRHLMHVDGKPFFWLGDTWWSALTARFRWPDTFSVLTADRVAKGFTVVQLVAGLVPEFGLFSPLMASEGGQPWRDRGAGCINPAFFDVPDLKIDHLVANGLVPCIVGGWGSWFGVLGREKILQHWRYIVARYAAFPVIWCIAGEVETPLPFAPLDGESATPEQFRSYLAQTTEQRREVARPQIAAWEEASELVAQIDPFHRVRTVHPTPAGAWSSSHAFSSRDSFDLDMLQTGHSGFACVPDTLHHIRECVAVGDKPVINGECCYEGIGGSCWEDVQRFLFWSHMLSGTAGHTYGTMAISTFSSQDDHYIPPSRAASHDWQEAIGWNGAKHVGIGRRILERIRWWELLPAPNAIDPHAGPGDWFLPFAAQHPDGSVVVYFPGIGQAVPSTSDTVARIMQGTTLVSLNPGERYRAQFFNPRSGDQEPAVVFESPDGTKQVSELVDAPLIPRDAPTWEDWVLFVRPADSVSSVSQAPW